MIEVFKTNVQSRSSAGELIAALQALLPGCKANFDLHDCDCILRIDSDNLEPVSVVTVLNGAGFYCEVLE